MPISASGKRTLGGLPQNLRQSFLGKLCALCGSLAESGFLANRRPGRAAPAQGGNLAGVHTNTWAQRKGRTVAFLEDRPQKTKGLALGQQAPLESRNVAFSMARLISPRLPADRSYGAVLT